MRSKDFTVEPEASCDYGSQAALLLLQHGASANVVSHLDMHIIKVFYKTPLHHLGDPRRASMHFVEQHL